MRKQVKVLLMMKSSVLYRALRCLQRTTVDLTEAGQQVWT
jgi:hypothetical protein